MCLSDGGRLDGGIRACMILSVEREVAAHDPKLPETVQVVGHCLKLCRHGQEKVREGLREG